VQDYIALQKYDKCVPSSTPNCTIIGSNVNNWILHENHEYFVSVRVENTAGLFAFATSNALGFDNQLATPGVVFDLSLDSLNTSSYWKVSSFIQ